MWCVAIIQNYLNHLLGAVCDTLFPNNKLGCIPMTWTSICLLIYVSASALLDMFVSLAIMIMNIVSYMCVCQIWSQWEQYEDSQWYQVCTSSSLRSVSIRWRLPDDIAYTEWRNRSFERHASIFAQRHNIRNLHISQSQMSQSPDLVISGSQSWNLGISRLQSLAIGEGWRLHNVGWAMAHLDHKMCHMRHAMTCATNNVMGLTHTATWYLPHGMSRDTCVYMFGVRVKLDSTVCLLYPPPHDVLTFWIGW